jgi:hypothetical protein
MDTKEEKSDELDLASCKWVEPSGTVIKEPEFSGKCPVFTLSTMSGHVMLGQISGVESQKTEPHPLLLHPAPILEIQRTEKLANQSPKMSRATRITNNKAPPKSPIPGKKGGKEKKSPKL